MNPKATAKSRSDETDEEESDDGNLIEDPNLDFENDERFKQLDYQEQLVYREQK